MTEGHSIFQAAAILADAKRAVAFTGAGISTPSGIPDFRSPDCGLWQNANPFEVASIFGFKHNPQHFYEWVYPLVETTLNAFPNPAHEALVVLEREYHLDSIITQNIDNLHARAGSKTIFELHGHLREATCIHCFTCFPAEPIIEQFLNDHLVPLCPLCNSPLKPNVILFGEQLPYAIYQKAKDAARNADVMLIIGSSLEVAPASELPVLALRNGAKLVIINRDPTHLDSEASCLLHDDVAVVLPALITELKARA
jgi:NAD-dependent deacetylase